MFDPDEHNIKLTGAYIKSKTEFEGVDTKKADAFTKNNFDINTMYDNLILIKINELLNSSGELKYFDNKSCFSKALNKPSDVIVGFYNKLAEFYNNQSYKPDQNNFQLTSNSNQIQRIKDSRIGATKMVMMHVVTG